MDDTIGEEQVRVTWLDCNCGEEMGYTSKYCDDHHARGTLVPLAMLRDPVAWMEAHDAKVRSDTYMRAAEVVHAEARWQWERDMRRIPGAQIVAQRMGVIEKCLTDAANRLS